MSLRIRFIEPAPPGPNVYDHILLPRLGTPLMATLLAAAGHDVRCYCENIAPVDVADCLSADLVGISSITSTQPAAYQLAGELEAAGVPVVLGGPHVTFLPDEALDHARFVIRGEGQDAIVELAAALEDGKPLAGIAGLSWRDEAGERHRNADRPRCSQSQFEELPAPALSLIEGSARMPVLPVMTQWGCPFDCDFCAVTAMFSRRVRYRRNADVLAELTALDARRVFFHDDNFVVSKARTGALLRSMAASGVTPAWFAQVRAETVFRPGGSREPDHEFLALMRAAGCEMVMVGFESTSDESLRQMNKKLLVRDIARSVELFHAHDILVHGMFVAGADTDAAAQAGQITDFARRHDIDTIQIMIETPLPGTRLFDRAQHADRLLSGDWSLFDGHHAVMRPALTDPYQLQTSVFTAMTRFYSRRGVLLPGLAAVARTAPALARLTVRGQLAGRFPALTALALRQRWHEAGQVLQSALPPAEWTRLRHDFAVPALRAYGRKQIARWQRQDRSQRHLAFLAGLG